MPSEHEQCGLNLREMESVSTGSNSDLTVQIKWQREESRVCRPCIIPILSYLAVAAGSQGHRAIEGALD